MFFNIKLYSDLFFWIFMICLCFSLLENWQIQRKIPMKKILSVNCNDIYRWNSCLLCPLVYTNGKSLLVYTDKITMKKKRMKKKWHVKPTKNITDKINSSLISVYESNDNNFMQILVQP